MLRFYAQTAPPWWPWQAVSLSNRRIPGLMLGADPPAFFMDNGAFKGYSASPSLWYGRLIAFARDILIRYPSASVTAVLPDSINDGVATLQLARHPGARVLCTSDPRIRCAAVAHSIKGDVMGRLRVAEDLAALDYVSVLAAPLKANCRRRPSSLPSRRCQLEVARTVCTVARSHGLECHLLAPRLDSTLAVLSRVPGASSFDSAAWIRPRRGGGFSPAYGFTGTTKEKRFMEALARLLDYGVPLELPRGVDVTAIRGRLRRQTSLY